MQNWQTKQFYYVAESDIHCVSFVVLPTTHKLIRRIMKVALYESPVLAL